MRRSLEDAKRMLEGRRQALLRRLPEQKDDEREAQLEREPAWEDAASSEETVNRLAALTEAEAREVQQIDEALERIESGRYGLCESCGSAIGQSRLRAVPEARLCLDCSSDQRASHR